MAVDVLTAAARVVVDVDGTHFLELKNCESILGSQSLYSINTRSVGTATIRDS